MQNAVEALLSGWDPLAYLRADGVERLVADAVLEQAARLRREEMAAFAEAIGRHVAAIFG